MRGDAINLEVPGDLNISQTETSDVVQLLAASACRGQLSSSMPESYSSSEDSLVGALEFKMEMMAEN